ncbi:hypothetical protein [Thalassobacillus pellis]|uniref:hypothetical protein n=1 Tax=Thalassobacillus pellis TaxID=748008 RepID=UPI001EF85335|nr:hypothetical protein [Thalassobacillus pellis]MBM7553768.1 hypothetical protein [Thalassobacillus pellis]
MPQYLSIEEFNELLKQWNGETIKITKHELEDDDTILLKLSAISYATDTRRIDDYEPMHTLKLQGNGEVMTDLSESQPLPASYYEIPLEDSSKYQFDNSKFLLETDRGAYTIEIASHLD